MNRRNPKCCCDVPGCCQLIDVKPLPTRTLSGGVVTYSDTAWDSSYVTGISGTDNTIPANTTVTIQVPIGCTDYVVDVEVLDDDGTSVTNSSPGLVVKVGDCLQASNVLRATSINEITGSGSTTPYQSPTIVSQYDVLSHDRSTPSFYGDNYVAYRFQEIFHTANMASGVISYSNPPFRSDTSTLFGSDVFSFRPPHNAGGLTVEITLQTGNQDVEIGLVRVHSGHMSCSSINSLDNVFIGEYAGTYPPKYIITDPSSYIYNNATSTQTTKMTGNVRTHTGCASTGCTYDYRSELDYTQWTGNHSWTMKWNDLAGYYNNTASTQSFHVTGNAASTAATNALLAYLTKCVQQNWTHSDRLIDWRAYEWVEPELNSGSYAISNTISITGGCNIVAETQVNIDADLDAVKDDAVYPSRGPLILSQQANDSAPCPEPEFCAGDPQLVYKNIQLSIGSSLQKWCKPIMVEDDTTIGVQDVKDFWNLPGSFSYPNAKASATASAQYSFLRGALTTTAFTCGFTYETNLVDIDLTESATITKIPFYSGTDPNYTLIGGAGDFRYVLPTRDAHLINLSLYIASETATFTATSGIVMQYSNVNYSTTRPNYATCGCPCTADELYQDDLFSIFGTPLTYWHRWMEFTDGSDTWYVNWSTSFPHNTSLWTFFFRRASDCKEITFTSVTNTLPSTDASVTKTKTNGSGDTLTITVQA